MKTITIFNIDGHEYKFVDDDETVKKIIDEEIEAESSEDEIQSLIDEGYEPHIFSI